MKKIIVNKFFRAEAISLIENFAESFKFKIKKIENFESPFEKNSISIIVKNKNGTVILNELFYEDFTKKDFNIFKKSLAKLNRKLSLKCSDYKFNKDIKNKCIPIKKELESLIEEFIKVANVNLNRWQKSKIKYPNFLGFNTVVKKICKTKIWFFYMWLLNDIKYEDEFLAINDFILDYTTFKANDKTQIKNMFIELINITNHVYMPYTCKELGAGYYSTNSCKEQGLDCQL